MSMLENHVPFCLRWVPGDFNKTIMTNGIQKKRKYFGYIPTTFIPRFDPSTFEFDQKKKKSKKKH
jgi:hypothetical protein